LKQCLKVNIEKQNFNKAKKIAKICGISTEILAKMYDETNENHFEK